jgi:hypothetical protein
LAKTPSVCNAESVDWKPDTSLLVRSTDCM